MKILNTDKFKVEIGDKIELNHNYKKILKNYKDTFYIVKNITYVKEELWLEVLDSSGKPWFIDITPNNRLLPKEKFMNYKGRVIRKIR